MSPRKKQLHRPLSVHSIIKRLREKVRVFFCPKKLLNITSSPPKKRCQDIGDCRYYYWYPIDYSPAPLFCYLYRSCLGGADEERVGVVVAGRHPGHYFMGKRAISTDVIHANTVCRSQVNRTDDSAKINRAGSTAEYLPPSTRNGDGSVVLCGGRNSDGQVQSDCIAYTPRTKVV